MYVSSFKPRYFIQEAQYHRQDWRNSLKSGSRSVCLPSPIWLWPATSSLISQRWDTWENNFVWVWYRRPKVLILTAVVAPQVVISVIVTFMNNPEVVILRWKSRIIFRVHSSGRVLDVWARLLVLIKAQIITWTTWQRPTGTKAKAKKRRSNIVSQSTMQPMATRIQTLQMPIVRPVQTCSIFNQQNILSTIFCSIHKVNPGELGSPREY